MTSNRFAVAIHILSLLETNKNGRTTSDMIAGSVNTNPVVIRRIMGLLSKAGLVTTSPGVAGAAITRPVSEITLLDIYRAVQATSRMIYSLFTRSLIRIAMSAVTYKLLLKRHLTMLSLRWSRSSKA